MKKTLLITGAMLMMAGLGLTSCGEKDSRPAGGETVGEIVKAESTTLGFQAATSLNYIQSMNVGASKTLLQRTRRNAISDAAKTEIEKLLPSVDFVVGNDSTFTSTLETSDKEEYAYKQVVKFIDLKEQNQNYTLYYNVTKENTDTETDDDDDDDATEVEKEVVYEGIALMDQTEFDFIGKTETVKESDEHEEELELRIFLEKNKKDSYIKVKQEISQESNEYEEEYAYEVYQNGNKTYSFSIEKETENQQKENEVEILLNGVKYKFEVSDTNDQHLISVKVKDDQSASSLTYVRKEVTSETETKVTYELVTK